MFESFEGKFSHIKWCRTNDGSEKWDIKFSCEWRKANENDIEKKTNKQNLLGKEKKILLKTNKKIENSAWNWTQHRIEQFKVA